MISCLRFEAFDLTSPVIHLVCLCRVDAERQQECLLNCFFIPQQQPPTFIEGRYEDLHEDQLLKCRKSGIGYHLFFIYSISFRVGLLLVLFYYDPIWPLYLEMAQRLPV
ncbi:hypothetical protein MYCSP_04385 [Mycobacteroides saopaulense]|nr:hypothetical protein MYCSP_04385 [Mycobacteroides saopaulense]